VSTPNYRKLPVKLTEKERMARAMTAAEKQSKYSLVEEQKKASSSELGRKLKDLRREIEDLQDAVRTGSEQQNVQIVHRRNESRCTIETVRLDTAEVIESRPMTIEERQRDLDFNGKKARVKKRPAKKAPAKKKAKAAKKASSRKAATKKAPAKKAAKRPAKKASSRKAKAPAPKPPAKPPVSSPVPPTVH